MPNTFRFKVSTASRSPHLWIVGIHAMVTGLAVAVVLEIVDVVFQNGALHRFAADLLALVLKARAEHLVELVVFGAGAVANTIQTVIGLLARI